MAVAFMLAHPYGIPRVMSSFEFNGFEDGPPSDNKGNIISPKINDDNTCGNGWVCEHRWRQIYNMVSFRNYVRDEPNVSFWWDNGHQQISFCRGKKGFIAINADKMDLKQKLTVCLPAGVYCDIISGELGQDRKCTGKSVIVDQKGQADVVIGVGEHDGVLAIYGGVSVFFSSFLKISHLDQALFLIYCFLVFVSGESFVVGCGHRCSSCRI